MPMSFLMKWTSVWPVGGWEGEGVSDSVYVVHVHVWVCECRVGGCECVGWGGEGASDAPKDRRGGGEDRRGVSGGASAPGVDKTGNASRAR